MVQVFPYPISTDQDTKMNTYKKGSDFEKMAQTFLNNIFEELGFTVLEIRKQRAGTQNGFDIQIKFTDGKNNTRNFFFECKNYDTKLNFNEVLSKVHQLAATQYNVDAFFFISPKKTYPILTTP